MNRLPPTPPGRWLDELLPGRPDSRPRPQPAWRFATAAAAQPATPVQAAPRPARVHGKPAAAAQSEPVRTVRAAPNPVREQPAEEHEAWRTGRDGSGGGQDSSGDGDSGGEGDAGPEVPGAAPPSAGAFDAQDIVLLLPSGNCSGIFEVQLPGGETMGVAVDAGPSTVTYHLKPSGKNLAERLRGQQTELTAHLERRIGKDVTLTIL